MAESVTVVPSGGVTPTPGTAGVQSQLGGQATTVSGVAEATGGLAPGNLIETDIDEDIFKFRSQETALMGLMLKAKKVTVTSPEVEHYMIDQGKAYVTLGSTAVTKNLNTQMFVLGLEPEDSNIPRPYGTLLAMGVNGYDETGQVETPGKPLMLFVTGQDQTTGNPVVRALNGPKKTATDEYCATPAIPAGTVFTILSNALYETQKEVDPDSIVAQPTLVYLQKRGMNQIVSDYFESQKKRIPFSQALMAEEALRQFKVRGNRTLWISRKSKFRVNVPKLGMQYVYTTEGVRWQFKRELQHSGKWTYEQFIALAKMFYTGEDVPSSCLALVGKNALENVQCIDFSKHPEVTISVKTNKLGWEVTAIHTVFGDIELKHEATLDVIGYSNSMALLGEDRLVHYVRKVETQGSDDVEGEEAKRKYVLVWDGLALKGSCHIWVDGEGEGATTGAVSYVMWDKATAPTGNDLVTGRVYYLLDDCPGIATGAITGQMWQYNGSEAGWSEYSGTVLAAE